ncbi:MAG TPA: hypothetical protein VGM27_21565 [Acidobacteriaceae bacterium]
MWSGCGRQPLGDRTAWHSGGCSRKCLWDLQGQALSVPAYNLFGGRIQERIRLYANINRSTEDRTPDGFARMAEKAIAASFDVVKLAPFDEMPRGSTDRMQIERDTQRGIDCAQAVRKANRSATRSADRCA